MATGLSTTSENQSGWGGSQSSALRITRLSKRYAGTQALDEVAMEVAAGTIHALVGGNGSGKSTLIKILAGVVAADSGGTVSTGSSDTAAESISPAWSHEHGLRFVHQDLGLFPSLTVAENLFAGRPFPRKAGALDWKKAVRTSQELLQRHHLDISPESQMSGLKPAEQTLVAIARAVDDFEGVRGKVLILDEPTARLPASDAQQLLQAMRRYADGGHAVVFVSHHLDEVLDVADVVTALRDGRVVGTYPIAGLDAGDLATFISGADDEPAEAAAKRVSDDPVLSVAGLSGNQLRDLDLTVHAGEIVGIAGLTGSGRTNLLELLFGARSRDSGKVEVDGRTLPAGDIKAAVASGVAYVPEDRVGNAGLMGLSLIENITAASVRRHRNALGLRMRSEARAGTSAIELFGVKASSPSDALQSLSGGNQQKVIVARWFEITPRVLLLDEPTQGVDVGARAELHRMVSNAVSAGACAVLVSSDSDELLALSDRILILDRGQVTDERDRQSASRSWLDEHFYRTSRRSTT